jgi:hypothetical protein
MIGYRRRTDGLDQLRAEIEEKGTCVMFPAVCALPEGGYVVLAGERRVHCMRALRVNPLPVHEIRNWAEFGTWMRRDQRAAQDLRSPGLPMNPVEAGTMANHIRELLAPKKSDWPDQRLADYLRLDLEQLRDGRYLTARLASDSTVEREAATEAVRAVLAGEVAVSTAIKEVGKATRSAITARAELGPVAQRKIINNAVNQAAGLSTGLGAVGVLSEYLTTEERLAWAKELRRSRLAFDRFIKALEGRA